MVVDALGHIARVRRRMKGSSLRDGECLGKISTRRDILSLKEHAGHEETWDRGTRRCTPFISTAWSNMHSFEGSWEQGIENKAGRSIRFALSRQLVCTEAKKIMNKHERLARPMQGTPKNIFAFINRWFFLPPKLLRSEQKKKNFRWVSSDFQRMGFVAFLFELLGHAETCLCFYQTVSFALTCCFLSRVHTNNILTHTHCFFNTSLLNNTGNLAKTRSDKDANL